MGLFSKDIKTMNDLFVHTLRDIYYAENQILKALPEMIEKATDAQLKQAFQSHLAETKNQVKRVEQVFQMHGVEAKGIDCPAIDGIIEEADDVAGEIADKEVLNAALAGAAQAVEHYEIARYGTLIAWAKQLGRNDCASVLQKNLDEEKAADKKLTEIAEARLNFRAAELIAGLLAKTAHADTLARLRSGVPASGGDPSRVPFRLIRTWLITDQPDRAVRAGVHPRSRDVFSARRRASTPGRCDITSAPCGRDGSSRTG